MSLPGIYGVHLWNSWGRVKYTFHACWTFMILASFAGFIIANMPLNLRYIRVLMWDMKPPAVDWELVLEAPVNPTFCLLLEMDCDMRSTSNKRGFNFSGTLLITFEKGKITCFFLSVIYRCIICHIPPSIICLSQSGMSGEKNFTISGIKGRGLSTDSGRRKPSEDGHDALELARRRLMTDGQKFRSRLMKQLFDSETSGAEHRI